MTKQLHNFAVKFYSVGFDEVDIFHEIFNHKCYSLNTKGNLIVMDIGMNVGLASLYFSKMNNVKKIYSYEPFKSTYDLAIENINLNPDLKSKIIPHNFGLSNTDEVLLGTCNSSYRGSASIIDGISPKGDKIQVTVKSAGNELEKITNENPNMNFVLKIDCEGGEIKIFDDKKFLSLLPLVSEIVMETHTRDIFNKIKTILNLLNFTVNSTVLSSTNSYIRAYK